MAPHPLGRTDPFTLTTRAAARRGLPVPPGRLLRTPDLADLRPGDLGPDQPGRLVDLRSAAPRDRPGVPLTLAEARAAAPDRWADGGLLLSRAVAAVHGGTAALRPGRPTDLAWAFEVTAAGRASAEPARTLLLPRLGRLQRPHHGADAWRTPLPPWAMRLARVLRAARPLADGGSAEWADDGRRCWLLLLHPAD